MNIELKKGAKRRTRYDWHIYVDGKPTARWQADSFGRGYTLWVDGYGPIRAPLSPTSYSRKETVYEASSKEALVNIFLQANRAKRIPDESQIAQLQEERRAKQLEQQKQRDEEYRIERIRDAAPDLLEALTECVERMPTNDPIYARQLATAFAKGRAALAKAKGE